MLERREERRSHLKTYREDEQDESKLLDELQGVHVDRQAQVTGKNAHEEHKGRAQRDAFYLHLAQNHSYGNHYGVDEY